MNLEFGGNYKKSELRKGWALHLWPNWIALSLLLSGFGLVGLFSVWALLAGEGLTALRNFTMLVAYTLILYLAVPVVMAERWWRNDKNTRGPVRAVATDERFTVHLPQAEVDLGWSELFKHKRFPTLLLIYRVPGSFLIIPRSFFSTHQDWHTFREAVKSRVPGPTRGSTVGRLLFLALWVLAFIGVILTRTK